MATMITTNLLNLTGSNPQLVIHRNTTFSLHLVLHTTTQNLYQDAAGELHVSDDPGTTTESNYEASLPVILLAEPGAMGRALSEVLDDTVLGEESIEELASCLLDYVERTREVRVRAEVEVVVEVVVEDEVVEDVMLRLKEEGWLSVEEDVGTCSVCLEGLVGDLIMTRCSHLYHESCIESWVEMRKDSCPLCRTTL